VAAVLNNAKWIDDLSTEMIPSPGSYYPTVEYVAGSTLMTNSGAEGQDWVASHPAQQVQNKIDVQAKLLWFYSNKTKTTSGGHGHP
jgi:hypothetical protein